MPVLALAARGAAVMTEGLVGAVVLNLEVEVTRRGNLFVVGKVATFAEPPDGVLLPEISAPAERASTVEAAPAGTFDEGVRSAAEPKTEPAPAVLSAAVGSPACVTSTSTGPHVPEGDPAGSAPFVRPWACEPCVAGRHAACVALLTCDCATRSHAEHLREANKGAA